MGYMGFGLQKWIYNLKPRRPFSKDRKSSGDTIPRYKREFTIKQNDSEKNSRLIAIRNLVLLVIICFLFGYFLYSFNNHSNELNRKQIHHSKQKDTDAFKFLYQSGKGFMASGNWLMAKSEFELALKIEPENIDVNKYYIQTLLILCKNGDIDCIIINKQIEKSLTLFPGNSDLHKLKAEYFFLRGDTSSAIYELERSKIKDN